MENKMTYAMALDNAINVVDNAEVKEKLITLKEQMARKATSRKPKVNTAKIELAKKVVEIMEPNKDYRVAELAKMLEVSTQKLTPAMSVVVENGEVEKHIEKRVATYRLV